MGGGARQVLHSVMLVSMCQKETSSHMTSYTPLTTATVVLNYSPTTVPLPPPPTRRDERVLILGSGWDSSDEEKMLNTFGMGRADLTANFLDLQELAQEFGYHGISLEAIYQEVLGVNMKKSQQVSRWIFNPSVPIRSLGISSMCSSFSPFQRLFLSSERVLL